MLQPGNIMHNIMLFLVSTCIVITTTDLHCHHHIIQHHLQVCNLSVSIATATSPFDYSASSSIKLTAKNPKEQGRPRLSKRLVIPRKQVHMLNKTIGQGMYSLSDLELHV